MAETVYLLDGSMEVICEEKDVFLQNLIREKLGRDAENCFLDCVTELQDENKYLQENADENEKISDGYHALCNNALEVFEKLKSLLSANRLNRKKLLEMIEEGYTQLNNNL